MGEMKAAIAKLRLVKVAGVDNILGKMVKYMGLDGQNLLLIIQLAWDQEMIHKDWDLATLIPIQEG